MRDLTTTEEQRVKAAIEEARRRLAPLKVIRWHEKPGHEDSATEFYAAIEVVDAFLAELRRLADFAQAMQQFIRPVLRQGHPPKRQKQGRSTRFRNSVLAETVEAISQLGFNPSRGRETKRGWRPECACSIVAAGAEALGMKNLNERLVTSVWERSPQAKQYSQAKQAKKARR